MNSSPLNTTNTAPVDDNLIPRSDAMLPGYLCVNNMPIARHHNSVRKEHSSAVQRHTQRKPHDSMDTTFYSGRISGASKGSSSLTSVVDGLRRSSDNGEKERKADFYFLRQQK
mmetsp:Transcript_8522/g.11736  ORF Transcript_8522/g.11736 Transcript_8522/m.11736 type:complete len:113 (-) Transcript_8522:339-677(-)|eukprot:CAMPEP_0185724782 /NCGR_PEP_ID=MMETSP1171-20130828/1168_1 /TAXON_ID=374046 /ORGANISM="Helicotheca tamensis, Strain CCMP826" /LENGTH=112 /DNA_ID=CAMNT_0028392713 /DNA_START=121 /DNA_END=459 /DNA_ORIENTATION=-